MQQIPEGILRQGDGATNQWVRDHPRNGNYRRVSGSVAAALAGVLVPAAKILKIRQLIKDLGGVIDASRLLIGAGTAAEKTEAIATAVGFLAAELLGIAGIRQYCFS
ncbi:MAG: hypothetical protein ACT4RN_05850 [Pseudonocardia sp.]